MKTPNYGRILDTRDLDARKDELESLRDAVKEAETRLTEAQSRVSELNRIEAPEEEVEAAEEIVSDAESALDFARHDFGEDEQQELKDLENAESEVLAWTDGNTLIPRDRWVDYVRDLLDDIAEPPKSLPSYIVIDWDKTADNIEADYSEIEIQGTTYLYRDC